MFYPKLSDFNKEYLTTISFEQFCIHYKTFSKEWQENTWLALGFKLPENITNATKPKKEKRE